MSTLCECWTEDIWRLIHVFARTSSLNDNEEKAAFCTLLLSLNQIISCPIVEKEIVFFMEQSDNNIMNYLSSNDRLFSWTYYLRQHVNKLFSKTLPSLEEFSVQYSPTTLTKDNWGPIVWKGFHFIMLAAKEENGFCSIDVSLALKAFITCLAILLPCPLCRKHAWEYYTSHSIDDWLDTSLHAFEWSVLFHNNVNEITNQTGTKRTYTPQEALVLYDPHRSNLRWKTI